MNYQAMGEYHAHKKQAKDAADRRFAVLHNLSTLARSLAENPDKALDAEAMRAAVTDAESAGREMLAALFRANQAAALCGESEIGPGSLAR